MPVAEYLTEYIAHYLSSHLFKIYAGVSNLLQSRVHVNNIFSPYFLVKIHVENIYNWFIIIYNPLSYGKLQHF